MSIASATSLGNVAGFIVDPKRPQVVALQLTGTDQVVDWDRVESFGPDAVTVADDEVPADQRGRIQALSDQRFALMDKRVLDDAGNEAGVVQDVDFDADSGRVLSLITSSGSVDGDRLLGCGSYAVMVRAVDGHSG
jgi:sporulation protein YlmC with PRC-barrel domain